MPLSYEIPEQTTVLWRYMSLAKLLALLRDRALFFARADRLVDPFEGAKGIVRRKDVWDAHYLAFFEDAIRHPPPDYECQLDDREIAEEARRLLRDLEDGGEFARRTTFLSCWHEAVHESEALWRVYGGDSGQAVAIQTTFQRFREALGDDPYVSIGRVQYIDFERSFAGLSDAFFQKRKAFEHEHEVRALIRLYENPPEDGIRRPVDIDRLIETVTVSPLAPRWFEDVVRDAILRFDCSFEVMHSQIAEEPFF